MAANPAFAIKADVAGESLAGTTSGARQKHIGLRAYVGTFSTSVMIQAFTVVQGIIIARLLGPTGRGEYATVILWPNVFAAIGIFGTNIALARTAAKTNQYDAVIRTALLLALITSAVSSALCYLCLPYLLPEAEKHLLGLSRVFVTFILLNHLTLNLVAVDQGAANFKRVNLVRSSLYPVYVTFLLVMWLSHIQQVQWAVIGLLVANLAAIMVRLVLALKDAPVRGPLYSPVAAIRGSVRFGLVGAALPLYQQADKAILLWLLGATNLGLYTVALSASAVLNSVTNSAGIVSFAVAARARQGEGFPRIGQGFRIAALLGLVFGAVTALLMPVLLPLIYGAEFASAINPARLLILGSAFAGLANLLDLAMQGQGRPFMGLEGRIVGLAVMIVFGVLLARLWGLVGVCSAFVTGQFVCLLVFVRWTKRHYGSVASLSSFLPKRQDVACVINRIATAYKDNYAY